MSLSLLAVVLPAAWLSQSRHAVLSLQASLSFLLLHTGLLAHPWSRQAVGSFPRLYLAQSHGLRPIQRFESERHNGIFFFNSHEWHLYLFSTTVSSLHKDVYSPKSETFGRLKGIKKKKLCSMTGVHWTCFKPRYRVKLWKMNDIGLLS